MSFFDILSIQLYSISKYYTHNKTCKTKNQQGHIDKGQSPTKKSTTRKQSQTLKSQQLHTIANSNMSIQFTNKPVKRRNLLQFVLSWKCANCEKVHPILLSCSRCKQVTYCDKTCQRTHWKNGHKHNCCPIPTVPLEDHVTVEVNESFTPAVARAFLKAEQEGYMYASLLLPGEFVKPKISQQLLRLNEQYRVHIEQLEHLTKPKEESDFLQQLKDGGVMELLTQVETIKQQIVQLKVFEDRNAETNIIIRKQDEIVGFCVVVITSKAIDLVHFYVNKTMRRKGICKQVVENVLKTKAREMKLPITVDTDHADHIWRQMGFVFNGETSTFGKKMGKWVP